MGVGEQGEGMTKKRDLLTGLGRYALSRTAAMVLAAIVLSGSPALGNSASENSIALDLSGSEPLSVHLDQETRTLYIGSLPKSRIIVDDRAGVLVSRAADLVGQPMALSRPLWSSSDTLKQKPWIGSVAMPSINPVADAYLTSGFGRRQHPLLGSWREHSGVDLAARMGTPIVATSDGIVERASWQGGYGLFIALEHGGGIQTRYGHMSRLNVSEGQKVLRGEVIGYVGSTGRSTGPHLHYEIRVNGQAVDPARTMRSR